MCPSEAVLSAVGSSGTFAVSIFLISISRLLSVGWLLYLGIALGLAVGAASLGLGTRRWGGTVGLLGLVLVVLYGTSSDSSLLAGALAIISILGAAWELGRVLLRWRKKRREI